MNEITIGIPTYNRPELLEKLIKELLKQTYPNFFIYVSVNKSKISERKYLKISKKFKNKNNLIRFPLLKY
jgi:glycosyltransferase involved in cell wall biosynthesis